MLGWYVVLELSCFMNYVDLRIIIFNTSYVMFLGDNDMDFFDLQAFFVKLIINVYILTNL